FCARSQARGTAGAGTTGESAWIQRRVAARSHLSARHVRCASWRLVVRRREHRCETGHGARLRALRQVRDVPWAEAMTISEALKIAGRLMDAHVQAAVAAMRDDGTITDDAEEAFHRRYEVWKASALARLEAQLRAPGDVPPNFDALIDDDAS